MLLFVVQLAEVSAAERNERIRIAAHSVGSQPLQPASTAMVRHGDAHGGSVPTSRTLSIASIGLLRVRAPERPSHATFGDQAHGRPAALRNLRQALFISRSFSAELCDRTSPRLELSLAFLSMALIQLRRVLVPCHGALPVLRSDDWQDG
jgi:hypothetical protein